MTIHFIGDVHGCTEQLKDLIRIMRPEIDDTIVFLGDLVDKGPDSAGTVKFVRALAETVDVRCVMGNHEENHLRWLNHADASKMKRCEEIRKIQEKLSPADQDFLFTFKPFVSIGKWLAVHAGVPTYLAKLPNLPSLRERYNRDEKRLLNEFCRLRYVDESGRFVGLSQTDTSRHTFWADIYDGRFGHAIYGHHPYNLGRPRDHQHATGIDLGCVMGNYLCALRVDEECRGGFSTVRGTQHVEWFDADIRG